MLVSGFRLLHFKSIVDTGWCNFSPDSVTVLVGQNESGKTSILEGLCKLSSDDTLDSDDTRIGEDLPSLFLNIKISYSDLEDDLTESPEEIRKALSSYFKSRDSVQLRFYCQKVEKQLDIVYEIPEDDPINQVIQSANEQINAKETSLAEATENDTIENEDDEKKVFDKVKISEFIYFGIPAFILFDQSLGLLPNQIDIDESKYALSGSGSQAATNFLTVAGLNLKQLVTSDNRTKESLLSRANVTVNRNFATFWSQTIGKNSRIKLECDVQTYGSEVPSKVGKKSLVFWISDGLNKLYPKQRSQGVRWFVSFYLQLKASEKTKENRLFCLDEPGANLHSKAQTDVLKLINTLSKDIPIVYSTHSGHLLEYDRMYRVLAIQRSGDDDDSPTEIISAHELGTASLDTLSPVLTAMGINLSNQEVVKQKNNVLLEEISGFYYLSAFWKMTKQSKKAYFIAATGVNKVEQLANMFLGWGLDFIVTLDDDSAGRKVYNELKRNLFGDDVIISGKKLIKIKDCTGIEDIFSGSDFAKYILGLDDTEISVKNSDYLKINSYSKPVLAYKFFIAVENGKIKITDFSKISREKITEITLAISERLVNEK